MYFDGLFLLDNYGRDSNMGLRRGPFAWATLYQGEKSHSESLEKFNVSLDSGDQFLAPRDSTHSVLGADSEEHCDMCQWPASYIGASPSEWYQGEREKREERISGNIQHPLPTQPGTGSWGKLTPLYKHQSGKLVFGQS